MWTLGLIVGVMLASLGALLVWAIIIGDVATHVHDYWRRHHPRAGG